MQGKPDLAFTKNDALTRSHSPLAGSVRSFSQRTAIPAGLLDCFRLHLNRRNHGLETRVTLLLRSWYATGTNGRQRLLIFTSQVVLSSFRYGFSLRLLEKSK